MYLEVITPDLKVFEGEVTGVKLPGAMGSFEILQNHAPIISLLTPGNVRIKSANGSQLISISGGLVEMRDNKVVVLAESAQKG